MLDEDEVEYLKKQFKAIDTENTGYIDSKELSNAMKNSNMNLSGRDIAKVVKEVDHAGNSKINYSEFLAATLATKEILTDAKLMTLFNRFDTDNSGIITINNLREAFENKLSKKDIK